MRPLSELRDVPDPGIDQLREWMSAAARPVELLPPPASTDAVLLALQVTRRSMLGTLAADTGGLLVDHGWLRHLGAGAPALPRDLATWNGLSATMRLPAAMLVADDVLGGFFAINGGALPAAPGEVCYFAPDTLQWESLEMGHSAFVHWTMSERLDTFYGDHRWDGWQREVPAGDQGLLVYPFLWADGPPIAERDRKAVPIDELWHLAMDIAAQLA